MTVKKSLQAVAELRKRGEEIPLVLMGYYNPMTCWMGWKGLSVMQLMQARTDLIIPDLPLKKQMIFISRSAALRLRTSRTNAQSSAPTIVPMRFGRSGVAFNFNARAHHSKLNAWKGSLGMRRDLFILSSVQQV